MKLLKVFATALIAMLITAISCTKTVESNEPQSASKKKGPRAQAARLSGDLFNTQGAAIIGTFEVGRGPVYDTLFGNVTDWKGLWWDYHYNYAPPIYQIVPGGQGATNYGQQLTTPHTFPWIVIVPHGEIERSYFFGVSSEQGFNVAGKTITVN